MSIEFPPRPDGKPELLARIRNHYQRVQALVDMLTEAELLTPLADWSVKDHLAHLAAWQGAALAALDGKLMHEGLGLPQPPADRRDWDSINATLHGIWLAVSPAETKDSLRSGHEALIAALEQTPETGLHAAYRDREAPEGVTIMDVVAANSYEHFLEHETWIREQLEQAGRGVP
jgi:hypothetical protein